MNRDKLEARFVELLAAGREPLDDDDIRTAAEADSEFAAHLDELRLFVSRFEEMEPPALREGASIDFMTRAFDEGFAQGRLAAAGKAFKHSWSGVVTRLVPAAAFVFVGIALGAFLMPRGAEDPELSRLRDDVQGLRQMVAVSLLAQDSPSQRLRGLQWTREVDEPEDKLVAALSNTLRADDNVNVRMAAADAMGQFAEVPAVRRTLIETVREEPDPLVQIQLIDVLLVVRGEEAVSALRRLMADPDMAYIVRVRAEEALTEMEGQQ